MDLIFGALNESGPIRMYREEKYQFVATEAS